MLLKTWKSGEVVRVSGMNKVVIVALVFLLTCLSPVYCCDQTDPVCVARVLFEKGATLRHAELKQYYCSDNYTSYDLAVSFSNILLETYRKGGVDYFSQEYHDFSNLTYQVITRDSRSVVVKISGKAMQGFKNTDIEKTSEVDTSIFLRKKDKSNQYCLQKSDIRKERDY